MASGILTLQNISLVKCAILLSLSPELKREILCVPGSEYDTYKLKYLYYRKEQWNAIIERKAKEILNHQELPENLKEKVINILPAIGLRMLMWAEYHEGMLGLTRYYSLTFLRNSHFTLQGLIDNKKAAEEMIKDVNLSIKQKYKLACIYCLRGHILTFFKQIVEDEKSLTFSSDCKWMQKPEIVEYWTSYLTGMMDGTDGENEATPHYRLEKSALSGSKESVKYFWEKTALIGRERAFMYVFTQLRINIYYQTDWTVFSDERFDDYIEYWVPTYFYLDILYFLLSNMTEAQKKQALEKSINGFETHAGDYIKITVLEMLLCWPFQEYFMKTAGLLWDLIPQKIYPNILFRIGENIECIDRMNLFRGEEKSYDYKKLLKDFWRESPDRCKRYIFTNKRVNDLEGVEVTIRPLATNLVLQLIAVKTFTYEDEENAKLILNSTTLEEKANVTSTKWWSPPTNKMLQIERFEIFDRLMLVFCKSEEETREFKKQLDLFNIARKVCYYFLKYDKINAVKSLIQWMSLSECELLSIKKDIIFSVSGMQYCRRLLSSGKYKDFEECIKWFLPSKDKAIEYKRELALNINEKSHSYRFPVHKFGEKDVLDFMTRFIRSKLPNREAIKGIQTSIADIFGRTICEDLIAGSSFQVIYKEKNSVVRVETKFTGGQWERVDEFLRWSLSTKKKILEFKKTIFEVSGVEIHFQLIKGKQWKEAKRFFEWLGLSAEEIKDLKKRTLFHHDPCWSMFHYLVFGEDEMSNLETIDLFLRWNLTDKITVIEFRDAFFKAHVNDCESRVMKLNKMIENYLDDLDKEESFRIRWNPEEIFLMKLKAATSKRKSTVLSTQKKIRLSSSGEKEADNENTGNSSRRRSQRLLNKAKKM